MYFVCWFYLRCKFLSTMFLLYLHVPLFSSLFFFSVCWVFFSNFSFRYRRIASLGINWLNNVYTHVTNHFTAVVIFHSLPKQFSKQTSVHRSVLIIKHLVLLTKYTTRAFINLYFYFQGVILFGLFAFFLQNLDLKSRSSAKYFMT